VIFVSKKTGIIGSRQVIGVDLILGTNRLTKLNAPLVKQTKKNFVRTEATVIDTLNAASKGRFVAF
jgi:hypothetical protein